MKTIGFAFLLMLISTLSFAGSCGCKDNQNCERSCRVDVCCGNMGGMSYCDSSAGRWVCSNGYYSSCYCTRHAIMDFQHVHGCCIWQGGVLNVDERGAVICNDGTISEMCTAEFSFELANPW